MDELADNFDLTAARSDLSPSGGAADEQLVEAACAGDEAAFEQLFERHRRRVARIVGRYFNRPEHVEEVVQEVFLKIYFALGDYSPERGRSFVAWLARVTVNACYDELRRARRRPESALRDVTDEEAGAVSARLRRGRDAESAVISRDLATKLLDRLTPEDRLVVTLLNAEDMPASDIAGLTGWTVSKVKVRAHRARAALRRVLSEFI